MTNSDTANIQPVIVSGGAGRRLWPVSRAMYPKQFQRIHSDFTLLQETVNRVAGPGINSPLIVCNEEHRFIVGEQLTEIGIVPADIILEPEGRNTAAAIAVAALWSEKNAPECVLAVLPSDHLVEDKGGFADKLRLASEAAANGAIVLFGIPAERGNPDYGYICPAGPNAADENALMVGEFREKPDRETAASLVSEGSWLWNTGIVVARPDALVTALEEAAPDVMEACRKALSDATKDLDYLRLERKAFISCPSLSFDRAVLESTDAAVVLPLELPWSDASSWQALWRAGDQDADGNVIRGQAITRNTRNTMIMTDGTLVAALGLENVVVVVTDDSVLVADLEGASDVESVLEEVAALGGEQHLFHSTIYRPWGSFHTLANGPRFQVKEIVVNPGASISLQKHFHRAEHWVVVEGTAKIRCGEREFVLQENESTYIPLGEIHRLSNPGKIPVRLIEVQSGSYLGEDDIVRIEDTYGRN
ncbi:MAG: mannose-1-phosphate guanylyltransferase/mannose-6-phosphate isomerase [Rhodospirillales bacterium]